MKSNSEIRVENLRLLIEEKGSRTKFIDSPLARDLKIEYGYVGQLVNGSRGIGNAVARKLEKIGGKPENWIDQVHAGIDSTVAVIHSSNASSIDNLAAKVPLISWVSAGKLCEAIDNYTPGDAEEWLPCPIKCGHNTFALRVEGDSMTSMIAGAKTYPSGCIIYVDPDVQVRNGSRVVARIDGHVTFKIYREDAGERWLMPINTQYEKIQLSAGVTICGVVIAKYEPE